MNASGWSVPASVGCLVRNAHGQTVPAEWIDTDANGEADELRLLVQLGAGETAVFTVTPGKAEVKKHTQAELSVKTGGGWQGHKYVGGAFENVTELRVPDAHTDHSYYIRYEGPGWESDAGAYRFYLDWRNGIDFFGKLTTEPVLQQVGLDGFDSYHAYADWGMDLLKVGKSLGLGSIGRHLGDSLYRFQHVDSVSASVTANELLRSEITTRYYGWQTETEQTNLTSVISIAAGSALTQHAVSLDPALPGFCTGLVISKGEILVDIRVGGYRAIGTFGPFSLNNDQMGLAIIVSDAETDSVFDDRFSHVVTFQPLREITYYLLATWEQGPYAVKNINEFETLLRAEMEKLTNPLEVIL